MNKDKRLILRWQEKIKNVKVLKKYFEIEWIKIVNLNEFIQLYN